MRAAVAEAGHRRGVREHRVRGVVVALGVVEERQHEHALAAGVEHRVVHVLLGAHARRLGARRDRLVGGGLVVEVVLEREAHER